MCIFIIEQLPSSLGSCLGIPIADPILETLAAIRAVTELRAHSLVAELIDDGIRTFPRPDRGSRGWYPACYSQ